MREIKFDIITLHTSGLEHYEHLIVTLDELIKLIPREITGHVDLWRFSGEIIAKRQSTGLTDSSRKEIFEGDILRFSPHKGIKTIDGVDVYEWPNIGVVFWDEGYRGNPNAKFNCTQELGNNQPGWWMCSSKEIIGNKWENPELLNETD